MDVVITEWALQSYVELKYQRVFTKQEYQTVLRPDAELLKDGFPSPHAKLQNGKFWGPATDLRGNVIQGGCKMKWHNVGSGRVQLRLAVAILGNSAYLVGLTSRRMRAWIRERWLGSKFIFRISL